MKKNPTIIILLIFLALTSFFWFQVLRIRDLPTPEPKDNSVISSSEVKSFVEVAQTLLVDHKASLPDAAGRDPFYKDYLVQIPVEIPKIEKTPSEVFIVSSVIYNKNNPLAVINGKILTEGDRITSTEIEADFLIENIAFNQVKINNGQKRYILKAIQ